MTAVYIETVKERCRVCYTCVRECPAKAIRISEGQAEIVAERCIACGNCVRVCGQKAKQIVSSLDQVRELLDSEETVAACLAPSFPAEFADIEYRQLVGLLKAIGFDSVHEVAFGADLVAAEHRRILGQDEGHRYIATSCPAIVGYVERYHPDLVPHLAPVISPMIATARYLKSEANGPQRIVFIGPCIAKKVEAEDPNVSGDVDAVLTFSELRRLIVESKFDTESVAASDFDQPHGGMGALYPISRGALQAADLQEDLTTGEIIATQGREHVREAIKEFADGHLGATRLLELLCCEGCIMGAGMGNNLSLFSRRSHVRKYVSTRMDGLDRAVWSANVQSAQNLTLRRAFTINDQRIAEPETDEIERVLTKLGKNSREDELDCGACGYDTCRDHAIAILRGLAENEMCLPHTIDRLSQAIQELERSHAELESAQQTLMQSEKLASMGQLAAGIAHEVNNPLGIVLMYAHLVLDECKEDDPHTADLQMIAEQADRCKKIVAGLLHFARQNKVARQQVDLVRMTERTLKPIHVPKGLRLRLEENMQERVAEIDADQIAQVLTNLVNNAIGAVSPPGEITVALSDEPDWVFWKVIDTGTGIAEENIRKIFEPFFTTKQPGKGTGLGLSVSYGIVKMHCGDIKVESNSDPNVGPTGTTFTVKMPRRG
jgi:two-component system NtrC family sensor kinase